MTLERQPLKYYRSSDDCMSRSGSKVVVIDEGVLMPYCLDWRDMIRRQSAVFKGDTVHAMLIGSELGIMMRMWPINDQREWLDMVPAHESTPGLFAYFCAVPVFVAPPEFEAGRRALTVFGDPYVDQPSRFRVETLSRAGANRV